MRLDTTIVENENLSQIPINILLCITIVVGILGNVSVCVVIAKNKDMRTASNYYLISLAISDLLIIVCSLLPWTLKILLHRDVFKGYACVIKKVASKTGYFATLLTIIAFTVERYIAICHPFSMHKINKLSRTVKVMIAYWIVALCLALPKAFYTPCFGNIDDFRPVIDAYKVNLELFIFVSYLATMILLGVLYLLMGLTLMNASKLSSTSNVDQRKIIKLLAAVVITLLICWTPTRVYRFYIFYLAVDKEKLKLEENTVNYYVRKITRALYYFVSTTVNPFIYNIMSSKFRQSFKKTFLCNMGKHQDSQPITASGTEENVIAISNRNMTE